MVLSFQDVEVTLSDNENNDVGSGENSVAVHAIVIDASTFNFIDTQAVNTLLQVTTLQVNFFLSGYLVTNSLDLACQ